MDEGKVIQYNLLFALTSILHLLPRSGPVTRARHRITQDWSENEDSLLESPADNLPLSSLFESKLIRLDTVHK
jgi:hypothetical protein